MYQMPGVFASSPTPSVAFSAMAPERGRMWSYLTLGQTVLGARFGYCGLCTVAQFARTWLESVPLLGSCVWVPLLCGLRRDGGALVRGCQSAVSFL
jgi:hypothetical protein